MAGCDDTYRSTVDAPGERCSGGSCKARWSCTGIKTCCYFLLFIAAQSGATVRGMPT
jgi:hypothetical protein